MNSTVKYAESFALICVLLWYRCWCTDESVANVWKCKRTKAVAPQLPWYGVCETAIPYTLDTTCEEKYCPLLTPTTASTSARYPRSILMWFTATRAYMHRDYSNINYCPHCFQSRGPAATRARAEEKTNSEELQSKWFLPGNSIRPKRRAMYVCT